MALSIRKLENANIYDSQLGSLLGRASEVELPNITAVMEDFEAMGMNAKLELPTGIDKMEAKIRWNSKYPEAEARYSSVYDAISLQVRSSSSIYEGGSRVQEQPVVIFLRGTPKNSTGGTFKQNAFEGKETDLNVTYYRLRINGFDLVEIDALNNIYKVNGVDKLANFRANLGI
jgi:P2 family phage contractile tail tube protein